MSIRKRFSEIFGLEDNVEAERKRFVDRVNQVIFDEIDISQSYTDELFKAVCFQLGVNANDFKMRKSHFSGVRIYRPASIRTLTEDDFNQSLLVLCILYDCLQELSEKQECISNRIKAVLSLCSGDIGIRWKEGLFYPSGAEELDISLIEETLTWLTDYPDEKEDYQRALEGYSENKSSPDLITNCYSAVEGIARKVLGNKKTLDNNKDELLKKMDLSDGWNSILATYVNYAHNYRHASPERHKIKEQEAEAYLYMTGLIIRLIIESK